MSPVNWMPKSLSVSLEHSNIQPYKSAVSVKWPWAKLRWVRQRLIRARQRLIKCSCCKPELWRCHLTLTAAAGTMRTLSLMKHESYRLTAVMTQALKRSPRDTVFTFESLKTDCNHVIMKPGLRTSYTTWLGSSSQITDRNILRWCNAHSITEIGKALRCSTICRKLLFAAPYHMLQNNASRRCSSHARHPEKVLWHPNIVWGHLTSIIQSISVYLFKIHLRALTCSFNILQFAFHKILISSSRDVLQFSHTSFSDIVWQDLAHSCHSNTSQRCWVHCSVQASHVVPHQPQKDCLLWTSLWHRGMSCWKGKGNFPSNVEGNIGKVSLSAAELGFTLNSTKGSSQDHKTEDQKVQKVYGGVYNDSFIPDTTAQWGFFTCHWRKSTGATNKNYDGFVNPSVQVWAKMHNTRVLKLKHLNEIQPSLFSIFTPASLWDRSKCFLWKLAKNDCLFIQWYLMKCLCSHRVCSLFLQWTHNWSKSRKSKLYW